MVDIADPRPGRLLAPVSLTASHNTLPFRSGAPSLDAWLHEWALPNQRSGASRTYVICDGDVVRGYYALATGAVRRADAAGPVRRQMPDPVPVLLLGRLAVDLSHQGQGNGAVLLQDALKRCLQVADTVGVRAVLVHAIDDRAAAFYRQYGFRPSPVGEWTLMVTIDAIRASL
ncbi:GNAT family N-acetyltransferase [Azospirillum halopraeferens]|uniref:GNAT family N-acetyltransferase n=1 Tax=Azospirillum halopraeferens TaxID=34010 RepID=UPI000550AFFC|nr:GNAT family N-acetyltransferase [Azospirillum halopraeferens]